MASKSDKCKIEVLGEMSIERYASFQMLYFPLIGADAAVLYHTLIAIGTRKQKIKNHLLIESISGLSLEVIEKSRHILEQYLLVKTYYRALDNQYLYQVYLPKDGNEFLRHEVFGRLYMKQMGKQVYEFNKISFAHDYEEKKDYQEITIPFTNILKEDWEDKQEETFRKLKPNTDTLLQNDVPLSFNFDRFLTGFSKAVFPLSARNEKNLRFIGELATIHGIDEMEMRKLVSQSMNLKDNTLQQEILKQKARKAKGMNVEKEPSNPYGLPPVKFLQNKQRGIEVSRSDKYLIETLITDFKMKPEVVNVLIEYVLETSNQRFTKSYVEKIAGAWVRLNIDTSEKALEQTKNENTEKKSYQKKRKELPQWYTNQDSEDNENEKVDETELANLMKQLGGEH